MEVLFFTSLSYCSCEQVLPKPSDFPLEFVGYSSDHLWEKKEKKKKRTNALKTQAHVGLLQACTHNTMKKVKDYCVLVLARESICYYFIH